MPSIAVETTGLGAMGGLTAFDRIHAMIRQHVLADGFHVAIDLDRSRGSCIVDAVSGREILDFYSYFATLPVGHNHPRIVGDPEFMDALASWPRSLRFRPFLNVTAGEVDAALDRLDDALAALGAATPEPGCADLAVAV